MSENVFLNHYNRIFWKKTRIRYSILKLLFINDMSEQELLTQICLLPEFLPVKNITWESDELADLLKNSLKDLIKETKIKKRDIYNTITLERRIEWFLNPNWVSKTRLFKQQREKREKEKREKEEQENKVREREEREKEELEIKKRENENRERKEYEKHENVIVKKESKGTNEDSINVDSILNGIFSIIAFFGGIYLISEIGEALNKAITFEVFLIACLVGYSIFHLTKGNKKD